MKEDQVMKYKTQCDKVYDDMEDGVPCANCEEQCCFHHVVTKEGQQ